MKKYLMIALCCLSAITGSAPLAGVEQERNTSVEFEAKMAAKLERERWEQAEFERASPEEQAIEVANEENAVSRNAALFGWGAPSYTTTHTGAWHFATAVSGRGNHVFLEDGSGWMIAAGDEKKTLDWMGDDIIMIIPAPWYSRYDYVLVNYNTGAHVHADLKERPLEYNIYSLWITDIDLEAGTLTLCDKTVWSIPYSYDRNIAANWAINQKVIIGINGKDGWLNKWISKRAPNILISVEPGFDGYIRTRCEY